MVMRIKMAKAYLMGLYKFTNKEQFKAEYGSKIADVFKLFGGHFLARTPIGTHHEGRPFDMHVIAEFPSLEKANEALESKEYLDIKKHRVGNSDIDYGTFVVIEGF